MDMVGHDYITHNLDIFSEFEVMKPFIYKLISFCEFEQVYPPKACECDKVKPVITTVGYFYSHRDFLRKVFGERILINPENGIETETSLGL